MTEEELDFVAELVGSDASGLCDIFSVLEGFRPVGHFPLVSNEGLGDDFFEKYGEKREDYPPDAVQISKFEKLLEKYYPDYMVTPAWGGKLYFLCKKDSLDDIKEFLSREDRWSLDREKGLGLLFSYPKCCVEKHCSVESDKRISPEKKNKWRLRK